MFDAEREAAELQSLIADTRREIEAARNATEFMRGFREDKELYAIEQVVIRAIVLGSRLRGVASQFESFAAHMVSAGEGDGLTNIAARYRSAIDILRSAMNEVIDTYCRPKVTQILNMGRGLYMGDGDVRVVAVRSTEAEVLRTALADIRPSITDAELAAIKESADGILHPDGSTLLLLEVKKGGSDEQ